VNRADQVNAVALQLPGIIGALDRLMTETIESSAHNIVLVIGCGDVSQYAANVPRVQGEKLLLDLFTRWKLGMPEVLPEITTHGADVTLFAYMLDTFSDLVRTSEKGSAELVAARADLLDHVGRLQASANRKP